MGKHPQLGARQPGGVHDAGMDQFVEDEDVVLAGQRGNGAQRGGVARGERQRGFGRLERSERRLQLMKNAQ